LDGKWDASWFIYPSENARILSVLKRVITQLKSELREAQEK